MKNLILSALLVCGAISGVKAQIGINTSTPDSSSAMDIQSPPGGSDNRGVLFPRMTTAQRMTIANPATSLFVYDTDDNLFYYHDGTNWLGLVPKVPGNGGSTDIKGNIILDSGRVVAPTGLSTSTLSVAGFSNNALVPAGAILMWSGNPANIPTGWALCNGLPYNSDGSIYTGTLLLDPFGYLQASSPSVVISPNLRGRFIVGYDPSNLDYDFVGETGGLEDVTLTSAQSGSAAHSHAFSATTSTNTHNHGLQRRNSGTATGGGNGHINENNGGSLSGTNPTLNNSHSHTVSGTTATAPAQNASAAHENRPPYYVLAYIIKLK